MNLVLVRKAQIVDKNNCIRACLILHITEDGTFVIESNLSKFILNYISQKNDVDLTNTSRIKALKSFYSIHNYVKENNSIVEKFGYPSSFNLEQKIDYRFAMDFQE